MIGSISRDVRAAIADPFAFGDVQPAWVVPDDLPPLVDIRDALDMLRARLAPTEPKHARRCLKSLRMVYGVGATDSDKAAWLKAIGAMPADLMLVQLEAAFAPGAERPSLETFTKPPALQRRLKDVARCEALLARAVTPKPVPAFVREPEAVRLRTLVQSLRRVGRHFSAAGYERALAVLEERAPESWVNDYTSDRVVGVSLTDKFKLPTVSPKNQAKTLRSAAAFHRAAGRASYAALLEIQANEIDAPPAIDEPLGDNHYEGAGA